MCASPTPGAENVVGSTMRTGASSSRRPGPGTPYGRRVSSTRTDRWVRLDGTTNTRDLGGLPTTDGGWTVPGRALRSDNPQTLAPADVRRLVGALGLTQGVGPRPPGGSPPPGRGALRRVP